TRLHPRRSFDRHLSKKNSARRVEEASRCVGRNKIRSKIAGNRILEKRRGGCQMRDLDQRGRPSGELSSTPTSALSSKPPAAVPSEPSKQSVLPSPDHLWCSQHSRREVSNYPG